MAPELGQQLINEICFRLPYKTKCHFRDDFEYDGEKEIIEGDGTITGIFVDEMRVIVDFDNGYSFKGAKCMSFNIMDIQPYLIAQSDVPDFFIGYNKDTKISFEDSLRKHIDTNGMISIGYAIKVTKEYNPYEIK